MDELFALYKKVAHFAIYFNGHRQPIIHDYPWLPVFVIPIYVLIVYFGPKLMANREPFRIKGILKVYNFFLAFISLCMFLGMAIPVYDFLSTRSFYDLVCMPEGELYYGVAFFCIWLFALSKYLELLDTVFLILEKKEIIFLHWYHHTTVLAYTWFSLVILTPPGAIFAVVNTFVHTIMYWYYYLSATGYRAPWARVVTVIQLSQMIVGIVTSSTWSYFYLTGVKCPMTHPNTYMVSSLVIYVTYFLLFLQLYIDRYHGPRAKAAAAAAAAAAAKTAATKPVKKD